MNVLNPATIRSADELTLDNLIVYASEIGASDLFLKADARPAVKQQGKIVLTDLPILDEHDVERIAFEHLRPDQEAIYRQHWEMNLSFSLPGVARIRQNLYRQRDAVATTLRLIPLRVKSLADLNITSKAIYTLADSKSGLVLVTGPTGSGKSTTLAAMIDYINSSRPVNIVTIEDPIEYVYTDKKAYVSQREVGVDTVSFSEALKQVLRQTPDVILIGELRDIETMNVALQAAETGHLVFATVHTSSAAETLARIANMFQPHERPALWKRLSGSLCGVISQKLLRHADGSGRLAAQEIMVCTPTISKLLEEGDSDELYNAIRTDGIEDFWGMQTMNQCLERYLSLGFITPEEALANGGEPNELKQMVRRFVVFQRSLLEDPPQEEPTEPALPAAVAQRTRPASAETDRHPNPGGTSDEDTDLLLPVTGR